MTLAMLTACAVDAPPTITAVPDQSLGLASMEMLDEPIATIGTEPVASDSDDLCALADALPADDLCSLVCDPVALEQAMIDAGVQTGRCYLLLCQMSETVHATVGVCLE